ncbi:MAG: hypothetical protein QG656_852 [Candidatus Hydrogenedentes bacterium]|nr:hypothetical protein [Candidatus Hydrogenedentota bacterium]
MSTHEHTHTAGSKCCCCDMSRRCFLGTSMAAVAAPLMASAVGAAEPDNIGEYIDIAQFRPKPQVKIMHAVVRLKPPYWLGWPGTSYDLEGKRKEFTDAFAGYAQVMGMTFNIEPDAIESDELAAAYVKKLKAEKPDAVLVMIQNLSSWNWVDVVAKAGFPTIVFAPIGTAFTGQVIGISRQSGVHVISSLEVGAVKQALRMVRAKRQFEESRVLVVAGDKRKESVLERLGTKVRYIPRDSMSKTFEKMPETDEAREILAQMKAAAQKIVEPSDQDILNAARSYMSAKYLLKQEQANAITTDCLGMVTTRAVPTPPCMAAMMFQDAGVTYGCEADLNAALSLMFTSYLFDKPGFMNDPVPETVKNRLIAAHCVSGTRLNGFDQPAEPLILRSHSESDLGVSAQVLWRVGQPVTLVLFQGPNEIILDTGTVAANVDTPPAGGCRTSFEIDMDRIEDARDVMGFHQVVFYGNHRRDVEAFCQMYGIKVTNSPKEAPRSI